MSLIVRCCLLAALIAGLATSAKAENFAPTIQTGLKTADELLTDLQFVLSLTNAEEQKQWPVLKEYLEIFLIGLDSAKPMRIDLVLGGEVRRYIASFPVKQGKDENSVPYFTKFREENLENSGIETKFVRQTDQLYECKETFTGFMRYKNGYATFAERKEEVPAEIGNLIEPIKPLIDKYDAALRGHNVAEGQKERRESFQNYRKQMLDAMKALEEESPEDFAFRKAMFDAQLDELERFYIEAEDLLLGWTIDVPKRKAFLEIDMKPLAGTSLDATVKSAGVKPSHFANIPMSANSILSGRLSHPLDEQRQSTLSKMFNLVRDRSKITIGKNAELSEAEKAESTKVADMFFDMWLAIIKAGLADGMVESHSNASGANTLIYAMKSTEGPKVIEMLNLVPATRKGRTSQLNVDEAGDVKIHKVSFPAEQSPSMNKFFGSGDVYVGTSADVLWCATGENALAELKEAIAKTATEPTTENQNRFASLFAKMEPWSQLRQMRAGDTKGDPKMRKMALDAFALGEDTLDMHLDRVDDKVQGNLVLDPGILRFVGKVLADFSKENLDEE